MEFVQPLRLRNTEGAWRVIVNGIHVYRSGNVHSVNRCHHAIIIRVSQKIQKSEFWNVTYPSGFHRLDEAPEKRPKTNASELHFARSFQGHPTWP